MRRTLLFFVLAACLGTAAQAAPQVAAETSAQQNTSTPEAIATRALGQLESGNYADVVATFDNTMRGALSESDLKAAWESLPAQAGAYSGHGAASATDYGKLTIVIIPLHFERTELKAKFSIDDEGRIAGFYIQPE